MQYAFEESPTVDELLAMRPRPEAAVAQSLAVTVMQEQILGTIIAAGPEGLRTAELAEQLNEPFTHVQRVTNGIRYERIPRYQLIKKHTHQRIALDNDEYDRALGDIGERAVRAEKSLRALGDTGISTMLKLATIGDRSPVTTARNRETIKLLLANAGLPVFFHHFVSRYEGLGILGPDQRDNNFYRRLQYMQRQLLFAHIIGYTKGHNHSSYTIEPDRLDEAHEQGLIKLPVAPPPKPLPEKPPKAPKEPKPKQAKIRVVNSLLRPTRGRQPDQHSLELSEYYTQQRPVVKDAYPMNPAVKRAVNEPYVVGLQLEADEALLAFELLEQLETTRTPFEPTDTEQFLLDKIGAQYHAATKRPLFDRHKDGTVRMSRMARQAGTIISLVPC